MLTCDGYNNWSCATAITSIVLALLTGVALTISIVACAEANLNEEAYLAQMEQRRESIVYQLENDMYNNDNEYGKKELYDSIQEWNEKVAYGRAHNESIWFGNITSDVYDMINYIEFS